MFIRRFQFGEDRALFEVYYSAIHDEATSLGLTELTSDVSRTAQPFFQKFGFSIIEKCSPEVRGVVIPNALMHKVLS